MYEERKSDRDRNRKHTRATENDMITSHLELKKGRKTKIYTERDIGT